MANQVAKKFAWVIKDFSSLQCEWCSSNPVQIGDFKWRLVAYPKGVNLDHLSLFLQVADSESLPCGWRGYAKYCFTIINQCDDNSQVNEVKEIFEKHPDLTSNFDSKNQDLKNTYMKLLLDLIKTLSKSPKDLTEEDLKKADNTLCDLIKVGLKLDWLRLKLDKALQKQIVYDARIRELEKQVKNRKLELAELEAHLEKEKTADSASVMLFGMKL